MITLRLRAVLTTGFLIIFHFYYLIKRFQPIRAYKIVNFMSENKIAISSGSACSSSSGKPSSTLKILVLKMMNYIQIFVLL